MDGLKDGDRVITLGHEFVKDGQRVVPVITESSALKIREEAESSPEEEDGAAEEGILQ